MIPPLKLDSKILVMCQRGNCRSVAVVAGSFDPITKGHLWVIDQATKLMDEVIIVVANNPDKKYTFSGEERCDLIRQSLLQYKGTMEVNKIRVAYLPEKEFLVNFAHDMFAATHLIRGLRDISDLLAEQRIYNVNRVLVPEIQTIFLITPKEYSEVSSSMIKGLVGMYGSKDLLKNYTTQCVIDALVERYNKPKPSRIDGYDPKHIIDHSSKCMMCTLYCYFSPSNPVPTNSGLKQNCTHYLESDGVCPHYNKE